MFALDLLFLLVALVQGFSLFLAYGGLPSCLLKQIHQFQFLLAQVVFDFDDAPVVVGVVELLLHQLDLPLQLVLVPLAVPQLFGAVLVFTLVHALGLQAILALLLDSLELDLHGVDHREEF